MSTPGGYDPNASNNPYGGNQYGSNPYGGANPPPPPGGNPYAAPGSSADAPMDGVSIAALVTAVLCCTGPIAVVLGIIGIIRTKDGQRRGRWMSVVGVVGGVLATIALAGVIVAIVWFGNTVVTPDNAEAGQCVNVDTDSGDVMMTKTECSEEHDAQIYAVHEMTDSEIEDIEDRDRGQVSVCLEEAAEEFSDVTGSEDFLTKGRLTIDDQEVQIDGVTNNPSNLESGDTMVCYIEAVDDKIEGDLLD